MVYYIAISVVENLCLYAREQVPLIFMSFWIEEKRPSELDEVKKTFMELKMLIDCYLLKKWRFLAVGITTTPVEILKSSFVGSQVIVLSDLIDRTRVLYNTS